MKAQILLSSFEQSFARLRAERVPCSAILNRGKGLIAVERQ
jgi:hypothetical protein